MYFICCIAGNQAEPVETSQQEEEYQVTEKIIYIVDDNKEFRESTAWMLEGEGYTVQDFDSPDKALEKFASVDNKTPCCILLDVRMPKMSGLDLHDQMNDKSIDVPVVYMTGHGDVPLAVEAMKKGALTFLEKPLQDDALKSALGIAFSNDVQNARGTKPDKALIEDYKARLATLTKREAQILDKVVEGDTNMNIGFDLDISIKTVELHRSRAIKKLGTRSIAETVKLVMACR